MWVSRAWFEQLFEEKRLYSADAASAWRKASDCEQQQARDQATIDWMRHRINALEKERTVLLSKIAGVIIPTPEIVSTGVVNSTGLSQPYMGGVGFEDVGDQEAQQLGIFHDSDGHVVYDRSQSVSQGKQ